MIPVRVCQRANLRLDANVQTLKFNASLMQAGKQTEHVLPHTEEKLVCSNISQWSVITLTEMQVDSLQA